MREAIIEIRSGSIGVESQDFAEMLMKMYTRWAKRNGHHASIVELRPGKEAGVETVKLSVTGENVYDFLKAEAGIHRMVRLSPFDAENRRHTSFARVSVSETTDEKAVRSYIFHPYPRVVDHRTGIEKEDVAAVINGEIEYFSPSSTTTRGS